MRYAYCHPTVRAGEMTHNARDTEARGNKGLQATLANRATAGALVPMRSATWACDKLATRLAASISFKIANSSWSKRSYSPV